MPWHERWFYLDWMLDDAQEGQEQAFDPNMPWAGSRLTPDIAMALGANVREI